MSMSQFIIDLILEVLTMVRIALQIPTHAMSRSRHTVANRHELHRCRLTSYLLFTATHFTKSWVYSAVLRGTYFYKRDPERALGSGARQGDGAAGRRDLPSHEYVGLMHSIRERRATFAQLRSRGHEIRGDRREEVPLVHSTFADMKHLRSLRTRFPDLYDFIQLRS